MLIRVSKTTVGVVLTKCATARQMTIVTHRLIMASAPHMQSVWRWKVSNNEVIMMAPTLRVVSRFKPRGYSLTVVQGP